MTSRSLILVALASFSWVGCADGGDESLLILRNTVPRPGCEIAPSTTFFARGTIDTRADVGYLFTPVIENITAPSPSSNRLALVEGANIDIGFRSDFYSDAEVSSLEDQGLTSFSQSFSGSVDPGGGQIALGFEVVPKVLLEGMAAKLGDDERTQITAAVTVYGTIDGGSVESNTFTYPIDVCRGCLKVDHGDCSALPDGFSARTGGVCQPLQDGILDCCTSDGNEICPAVRIEPL